MVMNLLESSDAFALFVFLMICLCSLGGLRRREMMDPRRGFHLQGPRVGIRHAVVPHGHDDGVDDDQEGDSVVEGPVPSHCA